jgi:hypothetical protein
MFKIESYHNHMQLFVFDFEFIGDVKNPSTCKLWDICIHHIQSGTTFNAIIDPIPGCNIFPLPPVADLFHVTRKFLDHNNAPEFSVVFNKMVRWVENRCFKSRVPILISHNNFSSDKLVLEHECNTRGLMIPINWLFFDSLIYFRDFTTTMNNEYSLKSLVKCILGKEHLNAHRAYTDTMALTNIIKTYTHEDYTLLRGNIFIPNVTSLRTIPGIGNSVEKSFITIGIETKEQLYKFIRFLCTESNQLQISTYDYLLHRMILISPRVPDDIRIFLVNQFLTFA